MPRLPVLVLLLASGSFAAIIPLSDPALSPNHSEIAFVSGGDIWTVPATGGEARLLISNPATESHPRYSPDGESLAFVSTRTGSGDIYVLRLRTGELKRITFDDSRAALDNWSADGKFLYFSSSRSDIGGMNDLYRVASGGGTPLAIAAGRYADESQAAPHPANGSVAFVSGNMAVSQWWRKGHSHIDETRIGLLTQSGEYQTILENHARNLWPQWSVTGHELFYVSDKSGTENIWSLVPGSAPRQITKFTEGRVLWPDIARDGKSLVFERDFRIWTLDPASGRTSPVEINLRGVPAGPSTTHLNVNIFSELALSPDGKKVAFIAHGDVFAASAAPAENAGGGAVRLTQTPSAEHDLAWAPDGKRIVYSSERAGIARLFLYDFALERETQLTSASAKDEKPQWAPDGKQLAVCTFSGCLPASA